jgi:hypothetical protein
MTEPTNPPAFLTYYPRPELSAEALAQIEQYVKLLKHAPQLKRIMAATAILKETMAMAENAKAFREARSLSPLKEDAQFMQNFTKIEKHATNPLMINTVLRCAMLENARLTLEVNEHRAFYHLPPIEPTEIKV